MSGSDPDALRRVLRHLASKGVFEEPVPGRFALNEAARGLLDPSMRLGLDLEGIGGRMAHAWGTLLTYVRTGRPAYDRVFGRPEEGRYADLRQKHGGDATTWLFWFFEAHAVAAVCFSLPALVAVVNPRAGFTPFEVAGAGLWILAFTGEVTADRQLERFKSDPVNRGRACHTGLWQYSRYPNYVFELLVWAAFATYASGSPWGWLAWVCPCWWRTGWGSGPSLASGIAAAPR